MFVVKRMSRAFLTYLLINAGAFSAFGQCREGIRSFLRYDGAWTFELHSHGLDQQAPPTVIQIVNQCRLQGSFVTCFQTVDERSKTLLVYKPTANACEFVSLQIPEGDGKPSSGLVHIAGNSWTYPWTSELAGHEIFHRVRNIFDGPGIIRFEKSSSPNGLDWTIVEIGEEHRHKQQKQR